MMCLSTFRVVTLENGGPMEMKELRKSFALSNRYNKMYGQINGGYLGGDYKDMKKMNVICCIK